MKRSLLADPSNLPRLQTLARMLRTCRPMGGRTERWFRDYYLHGLPGAETDAHGNLHVTIARPSGEVSRVIWSCHTDTVHRRSGAQYIGVDDRYITLADKRSNCLGADDTIGVWIMREMILANVPGHYVFHYGEERGGIGSSAVVRHEPERFADASFCIAFDRRGRRDVITHQAGRRTASTAFARSLAKLLRPVSKYKPSDRGIYTDSAEYCELVPECTNISVGYEAEHSQSERVDYWFAIALCAHMRTFDETSLVCARDINVDLRIEADERKARARYRFDALRREVRELDDRYYSRMGEYTTTIDAAADEAERRAYDEYYNDGGTDHSDRVVDAEWLQRYHMRRARKFAQWRKH